MAQQKYQPFQKLNEYFQDLEEEKIKFRKIGSKKFVYASGDTNNHIYFVLAGQVLLHFIDVVVTIPPFSIVGDFQLSNRLSTRISSLSAYQKAHIAILPLSYFSKIRKQKVINQNFIKANLQTDNLKLCYCMMKCFTHKVLFRCEELIAEHSDNKTDLILIKDGNFTVKKYIGVGVIEKLRIEVEKQFALIKVGEGELVKQNIICDSPRGEVFICKDYYVKMISKEFGKKAENIFKCSQQKVESHRQRYKQIKNLCIQNIEFASSILPSVLQSPKSLKKLKKNQLTNRSLPSVKLYKDKKQSITEPSQFSSLEYKDNYYQINRSRQNEIISVPTNSNLSLVPLVKLRRPSMPVTEKKELPFLQYFKSKIRKPNISFEKPEEIQESEVIPQLFRNRFQKKMFFKPNNPFHHYRNKSEQQVTKKDIKQEGKKQRNREKKLFFI